MRAYELGRKLPHARKMVLRSGDKGDLRWLGLSGEIQVNQGVPASADAVAVIDFGDSQPPLASQQANQVQHLSRRFKTSVPVDESGAPEWFTELAKRAKGDHLLAVLKADVDSLGEQIESRLRDRTDLTAFLEFADALDDFFTAKLQQEIRANWRHWIYTVFAGGDDFVMIGPWDIMFRFAEWLHSRFQRVESPWHRGFTSLF